MRDASLVENMRVKRSFTEPFSTGFWSGSTELGGCGCPFWAPNFGDFDDESADLPDLTEDGCDEVLASVELAMLSEAARWSESLGCGWWASAWEGRGLRCGAMQCDAVRAADQGSSLVQGRSLGERCK